MLLLLGSFAFGFLIGYVCWKIFFRELEKASLTFKTVGSLITTVVGAAVVNVFPANSDGFGAYLIGVCVGFFAERGWGTYNARLMAQSEQERKVWEEEYRRINSNWPEIQRIIHQKLYKKTRLGKKESRLFINELVELPFSLNAKYYIMQVYARKHIDAGVELKREEKINGDGEIETHIYLEVVVK